MMRKFFLKRVRRYFLCMLVPTLLVFAMSFGILLKMTDSSVKEEGKRTTEAVRIHFEAVVSNVLYQNDLLSNTTRMSVALRKMLWAESMSYSDSIYISSLRSVLGSITSSHDYVDSIYFYLDSCGRYFSSRNGVLSVDAGSDSSWLSYYEAMPPEKDSLVVTRRSNNLVESIETVTIYQRLLLQKGCIVVNLNMDKLKQMIRTMGTSENETIYILDDQGQILLSTDGEGNEGKLGGDFFQSLYQEGGRSALLGDEDGSWMSFGGHQYLVTGEAYEEKGIYIVSVIEDLLRNQRIANMLPVYALIFLGNCLIIVFIAYTITKRAFDQIQYMIDVFDDAEKGVFSRQTKPQIQDEYSVVMNNVLHLFVNTTYLNTQLKERKYRQEATELKALQLQINPHFLYNTLQSVDMEARKLAGSGSEISRMLQDVSDILKYSLSDSRQSVSVEKEIRYLKKYVEIQKFRFGDRFIIYYEVDEEAENARVFKLMLQPLVENSILHGVRDLDRKGYIKVKIFRRGERLLFSVTDNGVGMDRQTIDELYRHIRDESSESIGLTNVNRRLVLTYGEESALKIQGKVHMGACVSFSIPYEVQEQERR